MYSFLNSKIGVIKEIDALPVFVLTIVLLATVYDVHNKQHDEDEEGKRTHTRPYYQSRRCVC